MKQRRKKVLSLLLAAACSLSLGSQGAAAFQQQADTITDGSELSQMVRDHWEEDYFDQVVIDPKRETVTADGEKTTLEQSLAGHRGGTGHGFRSGGSGLFPGHPL